MNARARTTLVAAALALGTPLAGAQTVAFRPAPAEDLQQAAGLLDRTLASQERPVSEPLRRRLNDRLVVVTTVRRACPAAFRFTNATAHALYDVPTGMEDSTTEVPRSMQEEVVYTARGTSNVPYVPAHQSVTVYFNCVQSEVDVEERHVTFGWTVDEIRLPRLLVERRNWDVLEELEHGTGYVTRTGYDEEAEPAAVALAGLASMPPDDAEALRAGLAASWRGGRALYNATPTERRARFAPPANATPDALVGIASARIEDPDRPPLDAAAYRAACARAAPWARLDAWMASASPLHEDPFAEAVHEACAPGRADLRYLPPLASAAWQGCRAASFGVPPGEGGMAADDGAAVERVAALDDIPIDAVAAGRALAALDDALFERATALWGDEERWSDAWDRAATLASGEARARVLLDRVAGPDPERRVAPLAQGWYTGAGWRRATAAWLHGLPPAERARTAEAWIDLVRNDRLRPAQAAALVEVLDGDPTFARALASVDDPAQPFEPAAVVAALPAREARLAWSTRARCGIGGPGDSLSERCLLSILHAPDALSAVPLRHALHDPGARSVARLIAFGGGDATDAAPVSRLLVAHAVPPATVARPWCDAALRWRAAGDPETAARALGTLDTITPRAACAAEVRARLASDRRRLRAKWAALVAGVVVALWLLARYAQRRRLRAYDVDAP